MMQSDQVTDGMYEAAVDAKWSDRESCNEAIAAAITAMPDDLLRQLCAERGCVMVPTAMMWGLLETLEQVRAARSHDEEDWNALNAADDRMRELLDSDPRQQAQDDGAKHD